MDSQGSGDGYAWDFSAKRDGDDTEDESSPTKRMRESGEKAVFRFLIDSRNAGAVIGKGGSNINRLRTEFGATVSIPDADGPERVISLSVDKASLTDCLSMLVGYLDQHYKSRGGDVERGKVEMRQLVHQSQVGCIIGQGGAKVKELRLETGCQIKVFSDAAPRSTERIISVSGPKEAVSSCLVIIHGLLLTAPPRGHSQEFDAQNYDDVYAAEYGGWGSSSDRGRYDRRDKDDRYDRDTRDRDVRSSRDRRARTDDRFDFAPRRSRAHDDISDFAGDTAIGRYDGGGSGGRSSRNYNNLPPSPSTTQVTVPKDLVGAIIGRGGERIKQIRSESGASITIENAELGVPDRVITITGNSEQTYNAQYLLQSSVKKYASRY